MTRYHITANITQLAPQFEPGETTTHIGERPNFNLNLCFQNYIIPNWRLTGKLFSLSAIQD